MLTTALTRIRQQAIKMMSKSLRPLPLVQYKAQSTYNTPCIDRAIQGVSYER
ncbi:MAG: hypothetical protein KBT29_04285 [Prevotellaceae bacterium]|nr:hypothetical protein [Candidatus Minthosoma caballi]